MSPRYATLDGDTGITITGVFPTTIPVYVWFGDKGIVQVTSANGTTLLLTSPVVQSVGVTDVSVKFTLDTTYVLTLTNAFTFGTAPASTTTLPQATTTSHAPTTSGAPTTTVPGATTTVHATSTTIQTTTSAASTTIGGPTTSAPSPTLNVRLRAQPVSGALAVLTTSTWPRPGCTGASCAATTL